MSVGKSLAQRAARSLLLSERNGMQSKAELYYRGAIRYPTSNTGPNVPPLGLTGAQQYRKV